jgi:asparagine synthase (glutamine-hydrolysing)
MAHGLETRVPFLDNDLVDFAMRLPVAHKLRNLGEVVRLNENDPGAKAERYFQRTNDGKIALRKVMSRYVPDSISSGEKQGFSAPDASWFKGESIDYVRDELLSPKSRIWDVLDRGAVSALVQDHLDGRENRRLLIWSLLNVEWMMRKFSL